MPITPADETGFALATVHDYYGSGHSFSFDEWLPPSPDGLFLYTWNTNLDRLHNSSPWTVDSPWVTLSFTRFGGIAVDPAGNIYVLDAHTGNIAKVTPAGSATDPWLTTIGVSGPGNFTDLAYGRDGFLYALVYGQMWQIDIGAVTATHIVALDQATDEDYSAVGTTSVGNIWLVLNPPPSASPFFNVDTAVRRYRPSVPDVTDFAVQTIVNPTLDGVTNASGRLLIDSADEVVLPMRTAPPGNLLSPSDQFLTSGSVGTWTATNGTIRQWPSPVPGISSPGGFIEPTPSTSTVTVKIPVGAYTPAVGAPTLSEEVTIDNTTDFAMTLTTSTDSVNWRTDAALNPFTSVGSTVKWDDQRSLWIGWDGAVNVLAVSSDAKSWTVVLNGLLAIGSTSIAIVVTSAVTVIADGQGLWYSTDDIAWTEVLPSTSNAFIGVVWDSSRSQFLAHNTGNGGELWTSGDGVTWLQITPTGLPNLAGQSIIYPSLYTPDGSTIALVGTGATRAFSYTTDGGLTWHTATTDYTINGGDFTGQVAYDGTTFVAAGSYGNFTYATLSSTDLQSWSHQLASGSALLGVVWSAFESQFVAVGSTTRYTSPDGFTWTLQTPSYLGLAGGDGRSLDWSPSLGEWLIGGVFSTAQVDLDVILTGLAGEPGEVVLSPSTSQTVTAGTAPNVTAQQTLPPSAATVGLELTISRHDGSPFTDHDVVWIATPILNDNAPSLSWFLRINASGTGFHVASTWSFVGTPPPHATATNIADGALGVSLSAEADNAAGISIDGWTLYFIDDGDQTGTPSKKGNLLRTFGVSAAFFIIGEIRMIP